MSLMSRAETNAMKFSAWAPTVLQRLFATAVIALAGSPVLAHDVWIEPTTFSPRLGEGVGVRLRVGENLAGDVLLRDPALIQEFVYVDAAARKPLAGLAGDDPAGSFRVAAPGLTIIGYSSHPSAVELPAEKFNQYLKEEGLDAVIALRARRNEAGAAARERFSRCAKSLVLSGAASNTQGDRVLGLTLELVAERNPYTLRAGEDLPLRLIYQNHPLAGALVVALNSLNPARKLAMRSDSEGRVRFQLQPGGLWLIKAVHMERAPVMSKADWTSYWASLTFGTSNTRATNSKGKQG
jgi:uncharacterized GH25 family protein